MKNQILYLFSLVLLFSQINQCTGESGKSLAYPATTSAGIKRWNNMVKFAEKYVVFGFKTKQFQQYVLHGPRNYTTVVIFNTDDPSLNCQFCAQFKGVYNEAARSYHEEFKGRFNEAEVFWVVLNVETSRDLFMSLGLSSVPQVSLILPSKSTGDMVLSEHPKMQLSPQTKPQDMLDFIRDVTGVEVIHKEPMSSQTKSAIFLGIVAVIFVIRFLNKLKDYYRNPMAYFSAAMVGVFISYAGTVYNMINEPPMLGQHQDGSINFFYPGTRAQFVLEGALMSATNCVAALSFVGMVALVPKIRNESAKTTLFIIFLVGLLGAINLIYKANHIKNPWYPFKFHL